MFPRSNAEHIPWSEGGRGGGGGKKRRLGGAGHKGWSYLRCHLLACALAASPLHHVHHCKQANNNSANEGAASSRDPAVKKKTKKKTFVFTVHFNNVYHFYLYRQKGKKERGVRDGWRRVGAGGCGRIYMDHCLGTGQVFMARVTHRMQRCHHSYLWPDIPSRHIIL